MNRSQGRRFGLTVGSAFLVLGALFAWRGKGLPATIMFAVGGLLWLLAVVVPVALIPVERVWMKGAHAVSLVTTPIVMGLVYYVVLTPIGLIVRGFRGNPLKHQPGENGYWHLRDAADVARDRLERQF